MHIVAVYLEKGGSRKTSSTLGLARAFVERGVRVLAIDTDGQCHLSKWLLPRGAPYPERTILDVARDPAALAAVIVPTRIPNLDLVPGSRILPMTAESVFARSDDGMVRNPAHVLSTALEGLEGYGVVLIDCSPSVTLANANALAAATHVLCPVDLAAMSYEGLRDVARSLVQMVRNRLIPQAPPVTVLLGSTNERNRTTAAIERVIRGDDHETGGYTVLPTMIRYRSQAIQLYGDGIDAFDAAASGAFKFRHLAALADDYRSAATDLAIRLQEHNHA
ncbi:MAG: ParA family protein [Vulcanimicrobiaceae bacterium]